MNDNSDHPYQLFNNTSSSKEHSYSSNIDSPRPPPPPSSAFSSSTPFSNNTNNNNNPTTTTTLSDVITTMSRLTTSLSILEDLTLRNKRRQLSAEKSTLISFVEVDMEGRSSFQEMTLRSMVNYINLLVSLIDQKAKPLSPKSDHSEERKEEEEGSSSGGHGHGSGHVGGGSKSVKLGQRHVRDDSLLPSSTTTTTTASRSVKGWSGRQQQVLSGTSGKAAGMSRKRASLLHVPGGSNGGSGLEPINSYDITFIVSDKLNGGTHPLSNEALPLTSTSTSSRVQTHNNYGTNHDSLTGTSDRGHGHVTNGTHNSASSPTTTTMLERPDGLPTSSSLLTRRDVRCLDWQYHPSEERRMWIRRHCILLSLHPFRVILMAERIFLLIPPSAAAKMAGRKKRAQTKHENMGVVEEEQEEEEEEEGLVVGVGKVWEKIFPSLHQAILNFHVRDPSPSSSSHGFDDKNRGDEENETRFHSVDHVGQTRKPRHDGVTLSPSSTALKTSQLYMALPTKSYTPPSGPEGEVTVTSVDEHHQSGVGLLEEAKEMETGRTIKVMERISAASLPTTLNIKKKEPVKPQMKTVEDLLTKQNSKEDYLEEEDERAVKARDLFQQHSFSFEFYCLDLLFFTVLSLYDRNIQRYRRELREAMIPYDSLSPTTSSYLLDDDIARLESISTRVRSLYDNIQDLYAMVDRLEEEEEDLANMNLTFLLHHPHLLLPHRHRRPTSPTATPKAYGMPEELYRLHERSEELLEVHVLDISHALQALMMMLHQIQHGKDKLSLALDVMENRSLYASTWLVIVSCSIALGGVFANCFGMNLNTDMLNKISFWMIFGVSFALIFTHYAVIHGYMWAMGYLL